ncbi:glycosyltransferase 87 family protein [Micromonospora sp. C28SCA-DRY-2]|uniref:glycosyltransferase 87 family protein n=1 Tax=Micromonospora sp. C28SCA-DRY-2 TaxID=3059522 RepID=UPI002675BCAB|nr:glycosyltransferase 87 family protein [Micromonospora sp. C28SCA-DRY-2]MDO3702830.1 glycosyltransferase 87 family protein [Micromonospora sp. C28SCA-DRY-2]
MRDRRVVLLWAAFAVTALVSTWLVLRREDRLSDLHIYYGALADLRAGRPLYGYVAHNGGPFTYPPFAALVLWPVTAVPEGVAQVLWLLATYAAVVAVAVPVGAALTTGRSRRAVVVAAVALGLLLSAPVQSNLRFGQVSIFIVLAALLDGMGVVPARLRGILVGVAAAIKLTPLLFVVYFLATGRWRDAARALAAFVACAAIAAVVLPAESWTYWAGTMLETSRIGNLASLGNQSVHGMLLRVGVEETALPLVWAALVAAICAVALLRARHLAAHDRPGHAAVLVGCATVAASPVSWTHHQIWPVLAAMLLIGLAGVARKVAGVALLVAMVVSLGAVLSPVSTRPGVQFLFENARTLGVCLLCLAGFGGVAVAATRTARTAAPRRAWLRVGVAATATLAFFAVQPLPAGADPTFKAYDLDDVVNPRYFFVCRGPAECAAFGTGAPVTFGTRVEKTKVRVNGVVAPQVARLAYYSAPGGTPREIPLLAAYPGTRTFSFRSATMAHGRLVAYAADGQPIASYDEELAAAFRADQP